MQKGTTLLIACIACLVMPVLAQESPAVQGRVHLLSTGGTIASTPSGLLSVDELVAAVPGLEDMAELSVEDYVSIGSSSMTPSIQLGLARRVNELFADPELTGIIVTHGTDSLEETAYLLDLLVNDHRPVVFTAAQRAASRIDTDGPRNLLNAVRIATDPDSLDRGVLLTLNDEIHAARFARKTHTTALEAFQSTGAGKMGFVDGDEVIYQWQGRNPLHLTPQQIEGDVDLLTLVAGSDGDLIRASAASGAKGLVLEIFGRGNMPAAVVDAVRDVRAAGLPVVVVSRTRGGRVAIYPRFSGLGLINGQDLDGLKARMLLIAALGITNDIETLQGYFDQATGL